MPARELSMRALVESFLYRDSKNFASDTHPFARVATFTKRNRVAWVMSTMMEVAPYL